MHQLSILILIKFIRLLGKLVYFVFIILYISCFIIFIKFSWFICWLFFVLFVIWLYISKNISKYIKYKNSYPGKLSNNWVILVILSIHILSISSIIMQSNGLKPLPNIPLNWLLNISPSKLKQSP
jgi:hypothetical protein